MTTIRWCLGVLAAAGLIVAFLGVRDWGLFWFLLATVIPWLLTWVRWSDLAETIGPDHPDALGSLDHLQQHGHK